MSDPASEEFKDEASTSEPAQDAASPPPPKLPPGRRPYKRVDIPSREQMMQEEFMNNCGVRTVLSAVMGAGLGVMFGIFMGTMDSAGAVSRAARVLLPSCLPCCCSPPSVPVCRRLAGHGHGRRARGGEADHTASHEGDAPEDRCQEPVSAAPRTTRRTPAHQAPPRP